ncbi:MAG: hypothetical protein ACRDTI_20505 [Mycobacterium sp.]
MAVVDSSAYRPGGRVHDVVTDTRPLLVTESLLERIQLLLPLAGGRGQEPGQSDS